MSMTSIFLNGYYQNEIAVVPYFSILPHSAHGPSIPFSQTQVFSETHIAYRTLSTTRQTAVTPRYYLLVSACIHYVCHLRSEAFHASFIFLVSVVQQLKEGLFWLVV